MVETGKIYRELMELEELLKEKGKKLTPSDREIVELYSNTDNMPRLTWNNDFVIIHANKAFLDKLGYELSDLLNKPLFNPDGTSNFITGESLPSSYATVKKNLKKGAEWVQGVINSWYAKDGSVVKVEWTLGFNHTKKGFGTAQCKIA